MKTINKSIAIAIATIAVAQFSLTMSAEKTTSKAHNVVYYMHGENYYHKSAHSAKSHAISFTEKSDTAVYMQMESGAEKAHLHKCSMCYLFEE